VANDNAAPAVSRAEDDRRVAGIATRCLALLAAPDDEMAWEQAWERWRLVELAMN